MFPLTNNGGKTNRTSFLCGNRSGHHKTELRTLTRTKWTTWALLLKILEISLRDTGIIGQVHRSKVNKQTNKQTKRQLIKQTKTRTTQTTEDEPRCSRRVSRSRFYRKREVSSDCRLRTIWHHISKFTMLIYSYPLTVVLPTWLTSLNFAQ